MNNFLNQLEDENNFTSTENDALAFKSTKSSVLDMFALGGALRTRSDADIATMFVRAFNESPELALKMMFYFRDVRGGQGQRHAFRVQLKYLADNHPELVIANFANIAEYGRWDDFYALLDTRVEYEAMNFLKDQFTKDMLEYEAKGDKASISLLAKWLKSENTSSLESRAIAKKLRSHFGLSPKNYRKSLSMLRKHLDVVERKISRNQWEDIDYSHVPSKAGMLYRHAFEKHDGDRYESFINKVNKGEAKINASTLYPYEIIEKCGIGWFNRHKAERPEVLQAYWDNLPDYVLGSEESSIAVVDVSGSMTGMPINVALSLGLYLAERAKGPFADHFITFSNRPQLQKIVGKNIVDKVQGMVTADWDMNTNIEAVFDLILRTALKNNSAPEDLPSKIYIISDMQFDRCVNGGNSDSVFRLQKQKYEAVNYKLPDVVFWNVDARHTQVPITMTDTGAQLVSGFSPSIFKFVMDGEFKSPYELMLDVLNSERYDNVVTDRDLEIAVV